MIISAITRFGTNARPAIPVLVKIIESKQIGVANHALGALQKIDPEAAKPFIEKWKTGITNTPPHWHPDQTTNSHPATSPPAGQEMKQE